MSHFPALSRLLSANSQWATDVSKMEPEFFQESAKGQAPKVLWIGCADSRVPESVVTASRPGDLFVHRNIANQVQLEDDSVQSILTYAINHVGVEHVVIVGHTQCGGAAACAAAAKAHSGSGPVVTVGEYETDASLNKWLAPLTTLAYEMSLSEGPKGLRALVDENVRAQVANLAKAETITQSKTKGKGIPGQGVWVHGWIYELETGKLVDLNVSSAPTA